MLLFVLKNDNFDALKNKYLYAWYQSDDSLQ